MSSTPRRVAALIGAGILLLPAVAGAKPGPKAEKPAKPVKLATYVFKGVWHADGTVTVSGGNAKVRKGGYVGQTVAFDVTAAKLKVADTDADGAVTATDLAEGDKVVVQAKLPRTADADAAAAPIAARKVVDQTHPAVETVEDPAPVVEPAPEAPVAP
jgi:hypothetical protein